MEENLLRLHDLKCVAEARKRVEYLKKKRTVYTFANGGLTCTSTWMLNNLVDGACRDLKEMRRLRNNQGTLCLYLLCRIDQIEIHLLIKAVVQLLMKSCSK